MAALRIPLAIVLLVVGVYAAYYYLYVAGERDYLTGRNFRLLATMGEQFDTTTGSARSVVKNLLLKVKTDKRPLKEVFEDRLTSEFIPILKAAKLVEKGELSKKAELSENTIRTTFAEAKSGITWLRNDDPTAATEPAATVRFQLDEVLAPLLSGKLQEGIFDTVLLAAHDGRVIVQPGNPRLRIDRLDNLVEIDGKSSRPLDFAQLSRSSAETHVRIAGSDYQLLIQPCCARMTSERTQGWVIVGLIDHQAMAAASSAVPFSMMALLMALLLFALLSWPFLKLSFIGEAQRVTAQDVALVGLGGLLGIALVTVSALDLYAYGQLEDVLDDQLRRFSASVKHQANREVAAAYAEMRRLETDVLQNVEPGIVTTELAKNVDVESSALTLYPFFESLTVLDKNGEQQKKLQFDSFATPLINVAPREFFQYWRHARPAPAFLQPVVSATTGRRAAVLSKPADSWRPDDPTVTTLSIPMHSLIDPVMVPGFGFAVIDRDGRVLFHSDPDHNLSEDFFVESDSSRRLKALVSARHDEHVDLRYWGDDHRAYVTTMELPVGASPQPVALFGEPWTLVTFYDKALARTVKVEWLILVLVLLSTYGGVYVVVCLGVLLVRPKYRAPWLWPDPARSRAYLDAIPPLLVLTAGFAGSIVLFSPSDSITSAGLLPFVAWIVTYHALSPRFERRRGIWIGAIGAAVLLSGVAAIILGRPPGWRGALVALISGAVAWTLTTVARRRTPRPSPMALPVNMSYGWVAGLFLLLIAAMPSAAFFKVAHDTVIESFIKYGQLQIALDRSDQQNRAEDIITSRITDLTTADRVRTLRSGLSKWWGGYDASFFCTQVRYYPPDSGDTSECPPFDAAVWKGAVASDGEAVPELVEELLPFYSQSSVWFRELVHDQAADDRWKWARIGSSIVLRFNLRQPLELATVEPPFIGWPGDPSFFRNVSQLALVGLAVAGAIFWVARFVLRSVFVVDLIEPLPPSGAAAPHDSDQPHLFIVATEPACGQRAPSTYCELDLALAPVEAPVMRQWFDDEMNRLANAPVSHDVLIHHFDERPYDRGFNEQKLSLVEHVIRVMHRTVTVISAVPPSVLYTPSDAASDRTGTDLSGRWTDLLTHFTVIPAKVIAVGAPAEVQAMAVLAGAGVANWREIAWRLNALGFSHSASFLESEWRDPVVGRLWTEVLPYAWHPDRPALHVRQLIVEVGERAEQHYCGIWSACTPAERLVLGQVAEEGLVNRKTQRTVRALMARGLVRRQPHFTLMNETFRRFVLSPERQHEVDRFEEQSHGAWDLMRWPFVIILLASLGFFFATQQELFKTVLGAFTAAATLVPVVVKVATSFGEKRAAA